MGVTKMNSHFTVESLLSTFPHVLAKDKRMMAYATLFAREAVRRYEDTKKIIIYANIDELPESLLDILAHDFKVDWWDPNYTLEEKRKTLKDSFAVHRRLGTAGAVRTAISAVYKDSIVKEWFDYDGEPFHFQLLIGLDYKEIDPVKHQRVLDRLEYYKNLRSRLDGIHYIVPAAKTSMVYVDAGAVGQAITMGAIIAVPEPNIMSHIVTAKVGLAFTINKEVTVHGLG